MQKHTIKKIIYLGVVMLCIGYRCSVDEGGPTGPSGSQPVTEGIEAKVADQSWKAFNYSAYLCGKQITLTGLDSANGTITITLNDTVVGRTYELSTTSAHWATYTPSNTGDLYTTYSHPQAGGMVVLSQFNKDSLIVSGSFIFYAYNLRTKTTITISEGDFSNISITKESYPTSGMRAYIGGKLWTSATAIGTISDSAITIRGENANGEQIYFHICNVLQDIYALNSQSCHWARYIAGSSDTIPYFSNTSSAVNGKVVISNISADSVVQGSFVVSMYRASDKKTVQITQGLFNGIKLHR
jgi:hypothetical protein